jgi:dUTPase
MLNVSIRSEFVELPTRQTEFSVGFDCFVPLPFCIKKDGFEDIETNFNAIELEVDEIYWLKLGLWFKPDHDKTVWGQMKVRSSLSSSMIVLAGTIDGDYPNEWILKFAVTKAMVLTPGQAIAQVVFDRRAEISGLPQKNEQRRGGWGSTDLTRS